MRARGCKCGTKYYHATGPLKWNTQLESSARSYANQMKEVGYFGHNGSDGSSIGDRATRAGYSWALIGENLAFGHLRIKEVMKAWKESPTHCALIMNPDFRDLGAAKIGAYWVQHFGVKKKPRS